MKQSLAVIITSSEIVPEIYLIWLKSPEITTEAKPGQFVMVHCGKETLLRRPLSIHQIDGDKLALLFTIAGKGTRWLSQRKAGEKLDLLGPMGNGFDIRPNAQALLLVAGGIGIAPLRFLADEAVEKGLSITLLHGAHSEYQLYPKHLLPIEINLFTATEIGTKDRKGMMVTDLIPEFIQRVDQVFACGPNAMYLNMKTDEQRGLFTGKPVQVSLEIMMGCGHGICYGCTIRTKNGLKQACQDGPVFELDNIIWTEISQT
ncbi:dihydroorotate dehydrogenase electron transfer subunit [Chloroflexota bacterium]